MAIITTEKVYQSCLTKGWAVGGFIGYNLEIMQAAVEAAVRSKAPVLVQNSCRAVDYAGAAQLRAMAESFSRTHQVDLTLHLDHGDSIERCFHCIDNGFTSVMLDCEGEAFEENIRKTKQVVRYAHAAGAVVEGEVSHPVDSPQKMWTSVEEAVRYVNETGCDSLSICCGNAHGLSLDYEKKLCLEQIQAIHEALPSMPLVLHATSIFPEDFIDRANTVGMCMKPRHNFLLEDLQASYPYGICKVNSALDIKILFTTAVRESMLRNPAESDPRKYLGYAREQVTEYIAYKHAHVFLDSGRVERQNQTGKGGFYEL